MPKTTPDELAVFGAAPAFADALHVGRPNIGDRTKLLERIGDCLDRRWLTNNGPYVQKLERTVAQLAGVRHCIAVCNATIGLELVIRAAGLTGEVIVPSFTFVASVHALEWHGITPVFCDVDPHTHNLDPAQVEALITSQTTGIMGVHVWGRPCDAPALSGIAQRHGLKLVFDAAHAFGCSVGPQMIGGFGLAEVFSFHATKFINSFEGGAIVTNDDALAARLRLMVNFGFADYDQVVCLGTNGKMHEVSAAMGLTSIESMDEIVAVNRTNHALYRSELADLPGIDLVGYDERNRNNYQYVVIEVDESAAGISRDDLREVLLAENVRARRYFYPGCHSLEPYRSQHQDSPPSLPHTEGLVQRVMSLPTGTAVGVSEIAQIGAIIRVALQHGAAISRRLSQRSR